MKRNNVISKWIGLGGALLAFAGVAGLPGDAAAADQMKGAQRLMPITQPAQADALKKGDTIAMVCAKCKSVVVQQVTAAKGHVKMMTVGEKHLCPGCDSTIEVVGTGKGKRDVVKHICAKCGDESVFCCATKAGAGETKGMEKK